LDTLIVTGGFLGINFWIVDEVKIGKLVELKQLKKLKDYDNITIFN